MTLFKSVNYLRRLQRNGDHEAEIKMELTEVKGAMSAGEHAL